MRRADCCCADSGEPRRRGAGGQRTAGEGSRAGRVPAEGVGSRFGDHAMEGFVGEGFCDATMGVGGWLWCSASSGKQVGDYLTCVGSCLALCASQHEAVLFSHAGKLDDVRCAEALVQTYCPLVRAPPFLDSSPPAPSSSYRADRADPASSSSTRFYCSLRRTACLHCSRLRFVFQRISCPAHWCTWTGAGNVRSAARGALERWEAMAQGVFSPPDCR